MNGDAVGELGFAGDPRMKGFRSRTTVGELPAWIAERIKVLPSEEVALQQAWDRVLAQDIIATEAVPSFDRSAMDGYAVQAEETFGASDYVPASLRCVGKSRPGQRCEVTVGPCWSKCGATMSVPPAKMPRAISSTSDRWQTAISPV